MVSFLRKNTVFSILFFIIFTFAAGNLSADIIHLKDGNKIYNIKVTYQTRDYIEYKEYAGGPIQRISKIDIKKIKFKAVNLVQNKIDRQKKELEAMQEELEKRQKLQKDPTFVLAGMEEKFRVLLEKVDLVRQNSSSKVREACSFQHLENEITSFALERETLRHKYETSQEQYRESIQKDIDKMDLNISTLESALERKRNSKKCKNVDQADVIFSYEETDKLNKDMSKIEQDILLVKNLIEEERRVREEKNKLGGRSGNLALEEQRTYYEEKLAKIRAAQFRNLVFPGWGHRYTGNNKRGLYWNIAAGTSLALLLYNYNDVQIKKAQYLDSSPLLMYLPLGSAGFLLGSRYYDKKAKELKVSQSNLSMAALITAGVWIGSFVDLNLSIRQAKKEETGRNTYDQELYFQTAMRWKF